MLALIKQKNRTSSSRTNFFLKITDLSPFKGFFSSCENIGQRSWIFTAWNASFETWTKIINRRSVQDSYSTWLCQCLYLNMNISIEDEEVFFEAFRLVLFRVVADAAADRLSISFIISFSPLIVKSAILFAAWMSSSSFLDSAVSIDEVSLWPSILSSLLSSVDN